MIDQKDERVALRRRDIVLRAIAAEYSALRIRIIHMAADRRDRIVLPRHDRHVDAAIIIAVDQHHMVVRRASDRLDHVIRETNQRGTALRLDDAENIGADVPDHLCGIPRRDLVDLLILDVDPADPIIPAIRDDFDSAAFRPAQEMPPILPQDHEGAAVEAL